MNNVRDLLLASDPAELSKRSQRAILQWFGGDKSAANHNDLHLAWTLLRWASTVGAIDYLPREIRTERIISAANLFGLSPSHVVELITSVQNFDFAGAAEDTQLIIALEGLDSSGKTTQAAILGQALRDRGVASTIVSFPQYDSFFGRELMERLHSEVGGASETDPRSMALWYAMDRWSHFAERDLPLARGVTLLNRYSLSNAVYQASRCSELDRARMFNWVLELEHEQLRLPRPDLTIVLDIDPRVSLERSVKRTPTDSRLDAPDVYERSAELQRTARALYHEAAGRDSSITVVDGRLDVGSISEQIVGIVEASLS